MVKLISTWGVLIGTGVVVFTVVFDVDVVVVDNVVVVVDMEVVVERSVVEDCFVVVVLVVAFVYLTYNHSYFLLNLRQNFHLVLQVLKLDRLKFHQLPLSQKYGLLLLL